jgi:hypothetical protein
MMRVCVRASVVVATQQNESTARAESGRALCHKIEGLKFREPEPDADADENQANDDQCHVDGQRERYPRRLLVHSSHPNATRRMLNWRSAEAGGADHISQVFVQMRE